MATKDCTVQEQKQREYLVEQFLKKIQSMQRALQKWCEQTLQERDNFLLRSYLNQVAF